MSYNFADFAGKVQQNPNYNGLPTYQQPSNSGLFSWFAKEAETAPVEEEESSGLMGLGSSAFSTISNHAMNVVSSTRDRVNEFSMTRERLMMAGISIAAGLLFFFLAFTFLPVIIISPHKFALLFTMGSLCFLFALSTMKGHMEFLKHLASKDRIWFTLSYTTTMILTLYSTLIAKSYILALIFSIAQIVALAYFTISYIPGGVHMLNFIGSGISSAGKRFLSSGSSEEARGLNIV